MVTNIPAPYRLSIYELLARDARFEFKVFFCSGREPDREWELRGALFERVYLKERFFQFKGRFIHLNPDIWKELRAFEPDVVITTGFNPTHLWAYAYARVHSAKHIAMTDGTLESERSLTPLHRWVRRRVFAKTASFIGASDGAIALFRAYGVRDALLFKSHLCADNAAFRASLLIPKRHDFIFCGRFVPVKNPLFALDVAQAVARKLGRRVSIAFVGSGELEADMRARAAQLTDEVEADFPGFAHQDELPQRYGAARLLLFPTQWDPWGVVANEACAAGVPVLVSPVAGVAGELIRDGENGYVMALDTENWANAACRLLTDDALYARFSARCLALVSDYSYDNAAAGISGAVQAAAVLGSHP